MNHDKIQDEFNLSHVKGLWVSYVTDRTGDIKEREVPRPWETTTFLGVGALDTPIFGAGNRDVIRSRSPRDDHDVEINTGR